MNTSTHQPPKAGPGLQGGAGWKFAVMGGLSTPGARRVFTAAEFHQLVQAYRPGASASTARTVSDLLVSAGALRRVSSGVFLNRRALPPAELTEAAAHIRAGAVISLQSVLGQVGFLNNPAVVVMAVLPTSATQRPRLGEVTTSAGDVFRFYGLAEKFFPANDAERWQMLQPGRPCQTFRPEAALLHWLHLANMQRSRLTLPPLDVDMEMLDQDLLGTLATKWGLGQAFNDWHARAQASNFGAESDAVVPQSPMAPPSLEALDASAAARARLMAKRSSGA